MSEMEYLNSRIGILEKTVSSLLTMLEKQEADTLFRQREISNINYQASQEFAQLEVDRDATTDTTNQQ